MDVTTTPQTVAQAIEAAAQRQQQASSHNTPQTVAQAIEAATQQQEQQNSHLHQTSPPASTIHNIASSGIDNLVCQWQGCGERCENPEALYDHVCERHVGRKSTNNLNLTCAWGPCRTTTVKRDHITSHIRVHVPLKPHKCDFCGKSFKRPQDLKKHVKTHADDSMLSNSPQPPQHSRSNGGGSHPSKNDASSLNIAEAIQAYMANPRGNLLYSNNDHSMSNPYASYQTGMTTGPETSYSHQSAQYAGYGSVSYPSQSAMADVQSMDTRRRAIEALNDFLGDIKRRALNPNNYYDVGQRLQPNALPLPVATGSGYNMGYGSGNTASASPTNYSNGNSFSHSNLLDIFGHNTVSNGNGGNVQGPLAHTGYSLPVPNARTKNDLQEIDRFLEQLQATVYESPNAAAAAGIQQPGAHSHFANDIPFATQQGSFRASHSPTTQASSHSAFGSMSSASGLSTSQTNADTPALTPNSMSSYSSSGHSPLSVPQRPNLSSSSGMYPSLPAVTGISDIGAGYSATTSAPSAGLATGYDEMEGRRFSGGRLQKEMPTQREKSSAAASSDDVEMADEPEGAKTPRQEDLKPIITKTDEAGVESAAIKAESEKPSENDNTGVASPNESEDKRQEEWVENIRVIEAIRKWIDARLKNNEFETEDESGEKGEDGMSVDGKDENAGVESTDSKAAVETARAVEEQMAEVLSHANAELDNKAKAEVQYPSLPTA